MNFVKLTVIFKEQVREEDGTITTKEPKDIPVVFNMAHIVHFEASSQHPDATFIVTSLGEPLHVRESVTQISQKLLVS